MGSNTCRSLVLINLGDEPHVVFLIICSVGSHCQEKPKHLTKNNKPKIISIKPVCTIPLCYENNNFYFFKEVDWARFTKITNVQRKFFKKTLL